MADTHSRQSHEGLFFLANQLVCMEYRTHLLRMFLCGWFVRAWDGGTTACISCVHCSFSLGNSSNWTQSGNKVEPFPCRHLLCSQTPYTLAFWPRRYWCSWKSRRRTITVRESYCPLVWDQCTSLLFIILSFSYTLPARVLFSRLRIAVQLGPPAAAYGGLVHDTSTLVHSFTASSHRPNILPARSQPFSYFFFTVPDLLLTSRHHSCLAGTVGFGISLSSLV